MNPPTKKVRLEYSQGSNEGRAIYLTRENPDGTGGGYRIAGGKCWGFITPIQSFPMGKEELKTLIRQAQIAIKFLQKGNPK
jgi:hypothetical protein